MRSWSQQGGAAFPVPAFETVFEPEAGMSLRDWFAGQALALGSIPGTMSSRDLNRHFGPTKTDITRAEMLAASAYDIADAMLAERAKGGA